RVQNLGGDGIDWYGSLVGKRLATCTVRIACRGVVDGRTRLTEVSGPNIGRGHCLEQTAVIALECPIPTKKEKQLVLPDRATQGAARVIQNALALLGSALEELPGTERVVLMVQEAHTVELVGARLGDHGDGRAARHPLLGVETSRRDVDFLDGLRGRDVNSMVRQPDEDVGCAIHPCVVVVTVRAVDVEAQGPLRTVGDGVLESLSLRPGRGPGD